MARYIIISNLTDEGARTLKKNPGRVKEVNAELKDMAASRQRHLKRYSSMSSSNH